MRGRGIKDVFGRDRPVESGGWTWSRVVVTRRIRGGSEAACGCGKG